MSVFVLEGYTAETTEAPFMMGVYSSLGAAKMAYENYDKYPNEVVTYAVREVKVDDRPTMVAGNVVASCAKF